MKIYQIRKQNLNNLLNERAITNSQISEATGLLLSQLFKIKTGFRVVTDSIARRIEYGLGLELGWLDRPHRLFDDKEFLDSYKEAQLINCCVDTGYISVNQAEALEHIEISVMRRATVQTRTI